MNRQDIANLAFKITGIYCLVHAIKFIVSAWALMSFVRGPMLKTTSGALATDLFGLTIPVCLASVAIIMALAYTLLFQSTKWAKRMFPDSETTASPTRILAVHAMAFSIVGVFAIVEGLPELAHNLSSGILGQASFLNYSQRLIAPLLKLILGLALFFGSHGLVRIWTRLRYSGLRRQMGLCVHCSYDLTGNTSGTCPECGTPIEPNLCEQN